jgi:hypothetical protein
MQDEGRFSTIAINPRNPRVMLAGAGSAAYLAPTVNGGASGRRRHRVLHRHRPHRHRPVNPDIVYAGTGETFDPVGYTDGCGILKSTNGGDSWTRVAASILAPAGRLGLRLPCEHRSGDRRIGHRHDAVATTNLGLIRSTNSGASWSNVLRALPPMWCSTPAPRIWYAAIGNLFGAAASGVYISTNGGSSWALISPSLGTPSSLGRTALAVSPHDRDRSGPSSPTRPTAPSAPSRAGMSSPASGPCSPPTASPSSSSTTRATRHAEQYNLVLSVDPSTRTS